MMLLDDGIEDIYYKWDGDELASSGSIFKYFIVFSCKLEILGYGIVED